MPFLGAHMSVAGGLEKAFQRMEAVGGDALQLFTRNQRRWRAPELSGEAVARFQEAWERLRKEQGPVPVAAHASYLINVATTEPALAQRSMGTLADELTRAEALGIPWLVLHPGAHGGQGELEAAAGIARAVLRLDQSLERSGTERVLLLLETTAGQGSSLGGRFEDLAAILAHSRLPGRYGVCLDTAHVFAAGYDLRTPEAYAETLSRFDEAIGLERLLLFHLNDSKCGLGSRKDRHEHIGKGELGLTPFRSLLSDPRFKNHAMILETPKGEDGEEDRVNLKVLRGLLSGC